MSKVIIPGKHRADGKTDAEIYGKDCIDFECLPDGTLIGECRYCRWSLECQQIDIGPDGKPIPMEAHYLEVRDSTTGELLEHQLFCTGMHDPRSKKERFEDDKVS